jgi:predicted metal-binding membrane protein
MPAGAVRLPIARRPPRWAAILPAAGIAAAWIAAVAVVLAPAAGDGAAHAHADMHAHAAASGPGLLALAAMWTAMMVAMMVPPELPALAARLGRAADAAAGARAAGFAAGLFAAWTAFGVAAALLQWELERLAAVDAAGALASPLAAAALLAAIGAFQLTPLKRRCLERCRAGAGAGSPSPARGGSLADGLRHGAASLGSCALLMLVPLAAGGMALAPMIAVTALLAVEKLGRGGLLAGRVAGAALLAWSLVARASG